ncbi:cytochrome c [Rhodobacter sp. HX-7-19]|uniref:Cytochrome c n=1 Tax=Paragemmobacter kunshanensis TaxID=2583234 RepID=A0A6M1TQB7_9RHOB|nr:cytochrome c [Rhodobacter kunshanensis]NGQ90187.1 cytochrome c [Rhodobacter kunshanensis]
MKHATKALALGLALVAGVAMAAEATDPTVKARQELMDVIGMNTGILGKMAGGETPFDAAAAEGAKAAIAGAAAEIAAKFEPQAADPKSTAKEDIWANWDDFVKKGDALKAAAEAMDATTLEGVQAGMGAIGGSCKDCHSTYRIPS